MAGRLNADGDALRRARENAWLNQDELAAMAGLTPHTIMRIEKGHTPHPTRTTVRKIAKALEMDPNDLLRKDGSDPLGRSRYGFGGVRLALAGLSG